MRRAAKVLAVVGSSLILLGVSATWMFELAYEVDVFRKNPSAYCSCLQCRDMYFSRQGVRFLGVRVIEGQFAAMFLWVPGLVVLGLGGLVRVCAKVLDWLRWRSAAERRRRGVCPSCGYSLAGIPPGPCPECGAAPPKAV